MNDAKLTAAIKTHETIGGKPNLRSYQDTKGVWTAGYGRNLQAMTILPHVAEDWLVEDIYTATVEAKKFAEWKSLDTDARQNAFVEMVYNMGSTRLYGFTNMMTAIRNQNWPVVKAEALDSKWHKVDVGKRAEIIAEMFLTGQFQE